MAPNNLQDEAGHLPEGSTSVASAAVGASSLLTPVTFILCLFPASFKLLLARIDEECFTEACCTVCSDCLGSTNLNVGVVCCRHSISGKICCLQSRSSLQQELDEEHFLRESGVIQFRW